MKYVLIFLFIAQVLELHAKYFFFASLAINVCYLLKSSQQNVIQREANLKQQGFTFKIISNKLLRNLQGRHSKKSICN